MAKRTAELIHSKDYQKYYDRYHRGGCTVTQLKRLTELSVIKDWEFTMITGLEYIK